jgi:hypothetical protein
MYVTLLRIRLEGMELRQFPNCTRWLVACYYRPNSLLLAAKPWQGVRVEKYLGAQARWRQPE